MIPISLDYLGYCTRHRLVGLFPVPALPMPDPKTELLSGTLDLLILRVLNGGAQHGFAIAERIHVLSREVLLVEEGSLYPALYRMEAKGWIESEWGQSDKGRRAKFYTLTRAGRK